MKKRSQPLNLVFATRNEHKIREANLLVANFTTGQETPEIIGLEEIGCVEDIPETGKTIHENAIQKATFVTEHYGVNCFAEDTGLIVDHLDGAPGVHSARYAGPERDPWKNMQLLLKQLDKVERPSARFLTVVALSLEGDVITFDGVVEGIIIDQPRGNKGFGYDPVFLPDGFDRTFGEMSMREKNLISHRSRAFKKMMIFLGQ